MLVKKTRWIRASEMINLINHGLFKSNKPLIVGFFARPRLNTRRTILWRCRSP